MPMQGMIKMIAAANLNADAGADADMAAGGYFDTANTP